MPFLKSNNVKYCQILSHSGHFGTFLVILIWDNFTCFLHYSTLTIKKTNYFSSWIDFSDLNQIIYLFWFVGIWHYSTYYGQSCQIICFDLSVFDIIRLIILWRIMSNYVFRFVLFRFVLLFESPLFRFVSIHLRIQTL